MITAGNKLPLPIPERDNDYEMIMDPTPGEGVNIYIMDTGVMTDHVAFRSDGSSEKRARNFMDLKDSDKSPYCISEKMVGPLSFFLSLSVKSILVFLSEH